MRQQLTDLLEVVLETDRQPALVGSIGQKHVAPELIVACEGKPRVIRVAVDVVGLHAPASFRHRQIEPRLHDQSEKIELTDVEPPLRTETSPKLAHRVDQKRGELPPRCRKRAMLGGSCLNKCLNEYLAPESGCSAAFRFM